MGLLGYIRIPVLSEFRFSAFIRGCYPASRKCSTRRSCWFSNPCSPARDTRQAPIALRSMNPSRSATWCSSGQALIHFGKRVFSWCAAFTTMARSADRFYNRTGAASERPGGATRCPRWRALGALLIPSLHRRSRAGLSILARCAASGAASASSLNGRASGSEVFRLQLTVYLLSAVEFRSSNGLRADNGYYAAHCRSP